MFAELMALAIFLLFVLILTTIFFIPLAIAAINGIILFFTWYRIYHEKKKRFKTLAIIGVISLIITALAGWIIPLWHITTFSVLVLIGWEYWKRMK